MKVPVFKIKSPLQTFYIFGNEKLMDLLSDDGVPFNLIDAKLKELDQDIVITRTLDIEKLDFQIGEEVTDSAGHRLKIITVTGTGQYVVGDLDLNVVKYYNEDKLLKPNFKGSPNAGLSYVGLFKSPSELKDDGDFATFSAELNGKVDNKCGYRNPKCNIIENHFQTFTSIWCKTCLDEVTGEGLKK